VLKINIGRAVSVNVRELDVSSYASWDEYVRNHPDGTFFHLSGWKTAQEQAFGHKGHFLLVEEGGVIKGVLPLIHIKSLVFGNSLSSTPFCVNGGVLASDDSARVALEQAAIKLAQNLDVGYLEMRYEKPVHEEWLSKSDLYVVFRKELDPDPEKNMQNIPRKQRAMVRKGIDAGLQSEWDEDVDRLFDAYSQSVHALGTPVFSKRYFQILKKVFGDACSVLTITKDGQLIGSVMSFYFRDQVLPYYGGGTAAARECKGNDFMYWELMRRSCEQGIRVFDYGRSKVDTGAYSFKKNWGFEPQPLHYEYFLVKATELPNVSPTNPKYAIFIQAWKKMPLWMTRMIGPNIVKYTG
jgi:FemAB-related protein (PEP-CTERM system-associated)